MLFIGFFFFVISLLTYPPADLASKVEDNVLINYLVILCTDMIDKETLTTDGQSEEFSFSTKLAILFEFTSVLELQRCLNVKPYVWAALNQ